MHILVFSQHFWPESFRINDLVKDLSDRGVTISVLTGKPNYPIGNVFSGYKASGLMFEKYGDIDIYRVPMLPRGQSGAIGLIKNYTSFLMSSIMFGWILTRKIKIDAIFIYGTSPLIQGLAAIPLKYFHRTRLITWVQDLWPEDLVATGYVKNSLILKINEYLVTFLYKFSDIILIQSEGFRLPVSRITTNKNIFFLPNPIERSVFLNKKSLLPQELYFLKDGFNIIFAGNVGNNQSIDTVIDAAESLLNVPEIKIIVVGDGSRLSYLVQQIKLRYITNLYAVGKLPSEMMPTIYSMASALLVTLAKKDSLSKTVPSRVQAYLAAGVPIVGALDGEAALVIKSAGAGLVCPAEDTFGLIRCIKNLYSMTQVERNNMGKRGHKFAVENYHPEKIANEVLKYCTEQFLNIEET